MSKQFRVGLFPMCADVLHAGHIGALREAKRLCEVLIVALNTHPDGKRPVESVYERWMKLDNLNCVDAVLPYQGRRDLELVAASLDYDVRFVGDDYIDKSWDGQDQESKRGIEAYFIRRDHGLSSTALKQRIVAAAVH